MVKLIGLTLVTILLISAVQKVCARAALLPSIYAVASDKIESLSSPVTGIDVIRIALEPKQTLSDHSSTKRVIITETELTILRLEDELVSHTEKQTTIPANRAFWLENTVSKGFRHVGNANAVYLAVLWHEEYVLQQPSSTDLACNDAEKLLTNDFTSVCLLSEARAEAIQASLPKQTNTLFIRKVNDADRGYLILIK